MIVHLVQLVFAFTLNPNFNTQEPTTPYAERDLNELLSKAEYVSKQKSNDVAGEIVSEILTVLLNVAIEELSEYLSNYGKNYKVSPKPARPQPKGGAIQANRDQKNAWEFFEIIQDAEGKGWISFKAHTGYLCALQGGGAGVIADREKIGEWERFKVVVHEDKTYSFQTANGHYLCAEKNPLTIVADRKTIGPWEKFTLEFNKEGTAVAIKTAHGKYISAQGMK